MSEYETETRDEVRETLKEFVNNLTDLIYLMIKNRNSKDSLNDLDSTGRDSSKELDEQ